MPKRNKIQLAVGISLVVLGYFLPVLPVVPQLNFMQIAASMTGVLCWIVGPFLIIASTVYPKWR